MKKYLTDNININQQPLNVKYIFTRTAFFENRKKKEKKERLKLKNIKKLVKC